MPAGIKMHDLAQMRYSCSSRRIFYGPSLILQAANSGACIASNVSACNYAQFCGIDKRRHLLETRQMLEAVLSRSSGTRKRARNRQASRSELRRISRHERTKLVERPLWR